MEMRVIYALWLVAVGIGIWIGGSYLISPHLDDTSLPRRA